MATPTNGRPADVQFLTFGIMPNTFPARLTPLGSRSIRTKFCWVLGHVGIVRNEKVDAATEEAATNEKDQEHYFTQT